MRIYRVAALFVIALAVCGHSLVIAKNSGYGLEDLKSVQQSKGLF